MMVAELVVMLTTLMLVTSCLCVRDIYIEREHEKEKERERGTLLGVIEVYAYTSGENGLPLECTLIPQCTVNNTLFPR